MDEHIVMTQQNYDDLVEERDYLIRVKRPEIIERIQEARSHGDLSENAEYDAAREEQRSNEAKIEELEYRIKNADVRDIDTSTSYVHLNSKVTVLELDTNEEEKYTITSITEVDAMAGKISVESPLGSAILRKKVGDKVTVPCPDGASYEVKILKIE